MGGVEVKKDEGDMSLGSTAVDHSASPSPCRVAFTLGPWSVRKGVCRHDHPDTSADVHGVNGEFVADCGCHEQANANAALIATAPEMRHALREVVSIVDAAGLLNLSNGVQLGQTSWFVKASDAFDYARALLARIDGDAK